DKAAEEVVSGIEDAVRKETHQQRAFAEPGKALTIPRLSEGRLWVDSSGSIAVPRTAAHGAFQPVMTAS
ncbi:MAG: hypothetical protein WBX30_14050, partial [Stellaceae bacterium]